MSIHLKRTVFFFCILCLGLGCCLGNRANADDNLMHRIFLGIMLNNYFPAIGGRVIFNGTGLPGVEIFNQIRMDDPISPGMTYVVAVTDSKGEYRAGFSTDLYFIFPIKYGYQFDPLGSFASHNDGIQDFTAYKHTISGTVLHNGKGLENVEIYGDVYVKDQFVKKLLATTNSNGYYETEENGGGSDGIGGSFTLTPQLSGYEFKPPDIPIIGTEYLHENKDFIATKLAPLVNISGKVIWFNTPNLYTAAMEAYAEDGSLYSRTATDVDGNYSIPVPVGWTGTVKPFSLGFYFSPEKVYYSSLKENKIQNYTVMPPFSWTGNVIFVYAWKCVNPILPALTIKAYDLDGKLISTVVTGSDGIVNFALPYYWSGWVTAVSPGYTILPSRVDGQGWTVDHHQDFYIQNYDCTPE